METDKVLVYIAVIAVIISVTGVFITYNSVSLIQNILTGRATDTGTVNLSVQTSAAINFTTDNINWGSGVVDSGADSAQLCTNNGTVVDGNWTPVSDPFVVEHIGNVNVTLNINFSNDADSFLGGTSPSYQYNITNKEDGACDVGATGFTLNTWEDASTTAADICDVFGKDAGADEIEIDICLTVPSDSLTGSRGSVITMTAEAVV